MQPTSEDVPLSGTVPLRCGPEFHNATYTYDPAARKFMVESGHHPGERVVLVFNGNEPPFCVTYARHLAETLDNCWVEVTEADDPQAVVAMIAAYVCCYQLHLTTMDDISFTVDRFQIISLLRCCGNAADVWAWWFATGSQDPDEWSSYPDCATAEAWTRSSWSGNETRNWMNVGVTDPDEASTFHQSGFTPSNIRVLETDDPIGLVRAGIQGGMNQDQVAQWNKVGFADPCDLTRWSTVIASPTSADHVRRLGLDTVLSLLKPPDSHGSQDGEVPD